MRRDDLLLLCDHQADLEQVLERLAAALPGWQWQSAAQGGSLPDAALARAYAHGRLGLDAVRIDLNPPAPITVALRLHVPVLGQGCRALRDGDDNHPALAPLRSERTMLILHPAGDDGTLAALCRFAEAYFPTRQHLVPVLVVGDAAHDQQPGLHIDWHRLRDPAGALAHPSLAGFLQRRIEPLANRQRQDHRNLARGIIAVATLLVLAIGLAFAWPAPAVGSQTSRLSAALAADHDFSQAVDLTRRAIGLLSERPADAPADRLDDQLAAHSRAWIEQLLSRPQPDPQALVLALEGLHATAAGAQHVQSLGDAIIDRFADGDADLASALRLAQALADGSGLEATARAALQQRIDAVLATIAEETVVNTVADALYRPHDGPIELERLRLAIGALRSRFQLARIPMPAALDADLVQLMQVLGPLPDPARLGSAAQVNLTVTRIAVIGAPATIQARCENEAQALLAITVDQRPLLSSGGGQTLELTGSDVGGQRQLGAYIGEDLQPAYSGGISWRPGLTVAVSLHDDDTWPAADDLLLQIASDGRSHSWRHSPWRIPGLDLLLLKALADGIAVDANGHAATDAGQAPLTVRIQLTLLVDGHPIPDLPRLLVAAHQRARAGG